MVDKLSGNTFSVNVSKAQLGIQQAREARAALVPAYGDDVVSEAQLNALQKLLSSPQVSKADMKKARAIVSEAVTSTDSLSSMGFGQLRKASDKIGQEAFLVLENLHDALSDVRGAIRGGDGGVLGRLLNRWAEVMSAEIHAGNYIYF